MSGVGELEDWAVERLRGLLAERSAELLSPPQHRDRWLQAVMDSTYAFRLGRPPREPTVEFVAAALDLAAGILLELPRLELDAWRGWTDPRLKSVFDALKLAELPEAPPRAALAECWRDLRERAPFPVVQPKPGDAPQPVQDFIDEIDAWLGRLVPEAVKVAAAPARVEPGGVLAPMPRAMLGARLQVEVAAHIKMVRDCVFRLAHHLYAASFAGQRCAGLLQGARGEQDRLDEGRPLRARAKLRYHLAAWVLREASLTAEEIGLFLWLVDPSGLQNRPEQREGTGITTGLEKEVGNSLAYWTTGAGAKGLEPPAHILRIEGEVRRFLLRGRRKHEPGSCQD
jgi:hypothetical protein